MFDQLHPLSDEDVLAQPTRARLFALLGDLRRSAGTEELAERIGLHYNGARFHLERLERAGLVSRTRVRQARGRPRDGWAVAAGARPGGQRPRAYRDLSRWLARAIGSGAVSRRGIEAVGRTVGRGRAPPDATGDAAEVLASTLAALGFEPALRPGDRGAVTFWLGNCPYRDAVLEEQPAICALHRGITRGLLDVIEPGAKLAEFVPRDPEEAGCLIGVQGVGGAPAGD